MKYRADLTANGVYKNWFHFTMQNELAWRQFEAKLFFEELNELKEAKGEKRRNGK
jgi:hypothetical protein